jgi:uncharacterized membrane protein YbhN (UPF0104 family)
MNKARSRWWMRAAVSGGALGLLLILVPVDELYVALRRVPGHLLLASVTVFIAGHLAAAFKWRLLQGHDIGLSTLTTLRAHFAGVVANLWLPSVVGGDVVRAGVVLRTATRPGVVALAGIVDRAVDTFALLMLAAIGVLFVGAPATDARRLLMLIGVALAVPGVLAIIGYKYLVARQANTKARRLLDLIQHALDRRGAIAASFVISAVIQAAFVLVNVGLGRAVGVVAPVSIWFMAWPLAKLAALLPVSVAGIGVREVALVSLMRPFGDDPAAIMAAGLLWQAVFMGGGILGWAVLSLAVGNAQPERRPLESVGK